MEMKMTERNEEQSDNQNDQNQPQNNTDTQTRTDPSEMLSVYQQQLLAESRRNANLERELAELRKTPLAPPKVITEAEEKAFFDRPTTATRDIVREELGNQVAPINQFIAEQRRTSELAYLKGQMRELPAQFPYIGQVERVLDQILANTQVIDPNVVGNAYNMAVGQFVSSGGNLTRSDNTNNPQPTNNNVPQPLPPHVRPNSPAPITRNDKKPTRQLNENEKKIARFNGFTDEQYINWTDNVNPTEVAHITDEQLTSRTK